MATTSEESLPDGWLTYQYVCQGYRVNYSYRMAAASIFSTRHNEFWIIWSDIFPIILFSGMYQWGKRQETYHHEVARSTMFAGAIICRCCSLVYHTFHCVSPRLNRDLIYLDLIGICTNALGVPWTVVGIAEWDDTTMSTKLYICVFMSCYAACICVFSHHLFSNGIHLYFFRSSAATEQYMIIALAIAGCIPAVMAGFFSGPLCFAIGYAFFYVGKFPEGWLSSKHKHSVSGQIWNSHVLWHAATWAGQMCFICTSM